MFLLIIYYSYLNNSINVSERGPGNFIWQIFSNYHLPFLVFFFFFLSIFCPLALLTENMPPIFPFSFKIEVNFTYSEMYRSFKCISSVQSLSCVRLFVTPWITARQASLSITISRSSLRLTSIESVMPSSYLILGRPLLLKFNTCIQPCHHYNHHTLPVWNTKYSFTLNQLVDIFFFNPLTCLKFKWNSSFWSRAPRLCLLWPGSC